MRTILHCFAVLALALMITGCGKKASETPPEKEQQPMSIDIRGKRWIFAEAMDTAARSTDPEREVYIEFDSESDKFSGFAGCNRFGGTYTVDAEAGTLTLSQVFATKMMCPEMALEEAVMQALNKANGYAYTEGMLHLTQDGTEILATLHEGKS